MALPVAQSRGRECPTPIQPGCFIPLWAVTAPLLGETGWPKGRPETAAAGQRPRSPFIVQDKAAASPAPPRGQPLLPGIVYHTHASVTIPWLRAHTHTHVWTQELCKVTRSVQPSKSILYSPFPAPLQKNTPCNQPASILPCSLQSLGLQTFIPHCSLRGDKAVYN